MTLGVLSTKKTTGKGMAMDQGTRQGTSQEAGQGTPQEAGQRKEALRKRLLAARESLPQADHARLSYAIVEKLKDDPIFLQATCILSYQPFHSEVDISAFNEWALDKGIKLAYPICLDNQKMIAAVPHATTALLPGRFGIKAPDPKKSQLIEPQNIECVLVPCLGFCDEGYRLGRGGGYYDRYLPTCRKATKVGVAFSLQRIDEPFHDPWDIVLDRFITDR